jgi:hypothetical protein
MKKLFLIPIIALLAQGITMTSCKSKAAPTFCDTACNSDTLKFSLDHPDHPALTISMKDCAPDSISWGNDNLLNNRKMKFSDLAGEAVKVNKNFIRAYFKDTSYIWLQFNDCINAQGYVMKLFYNKEQSLSPRNSAFTSFDPKYNVAENLAAWSDRGNMFVEDMETGKKAMMTFGEKTGLDYNALHETIDSVNISNTRIWVHVKLKDGWKELQKPIVLE